MSSFAEHLQKDIINYQEKYQVPYFEDSSNQDTKYVRNDIRQRIIPSIDNNPFLDSHHLLKLKEWHDNELQLLKEHARYFVAHFVSKNDSVAGYTFSREAFNRLNPNVKTTVMDQLLEDIVTHSTISQKRMTSGSNKSKMKNLNFISILQING